MPFFLKKHNVTMISWFSHNFLKILLFLRLEFFLITIYTSLPPHQLPFLFLSSSLAKVITSMEDPSKLALPLHAVTHREGWEPLCWVQNDFVAWRQGKTPEKAWIGPWLHKDIGSHFARLLWLAVGSGHSGCIRVTACRYSTRWIFCQVSW